MSEKREKGEVKESGTKSGEREKEIGRGRGRERERGVKSAEYVARQVSKDK